MHGASSGLLAVPRQARSYCSALPIRSSQLTLQKDSLADLLPQLLETRSSIREDFCPPEF